ncbi:hypothetical protein G7Y89_g9663 [Cudoniella acicularis]|uniref:C2H2-type domain-containing protein n=1 Tax=Cudoniella acicularis TaxID=354080 RepID=A0A8H4RE82_9HELO|nr:hypothetical protein G7Y89_g9663 [Cudoniella acicularis]
MRIRMLIGLAGVHSLEVMEATTVLNSRAALNTAKGVHKKAFLLISLLGILVSRIFVTRYFHKPARFHLRLTLEQLQVPHVFPKSTELPTQQIILVLTLYHSSSAYKKDSGLNLNTPKKTTKDHRSSVARKSPEAIAHSIDSHGTVDFPYSAESKICNSNSTKQTATRHYVNFSNATTAGYSSDQNCVSKDYAAVITSGIGFLGISIDQTCQEAMLERFEKNTSWVVAERGEKVEFEKNNFLEDNTHPAFNFGSPTSSQSTSSRSQGITLSELEKENPSVQQYTQSLQTPALSPSQYSHPPEDCAAFTDTPGPSSSISFHSTILSQRYTQFPQTPALSPSGYSQPPEDCGSSQSTPRSSSSLRSRNNSQPFEFGDQTPDNPVVVIQRQATSNRTHWQLATQSHAAGNFGREEYNGNTALHPLTSGIENLLGAQQRVQPANQNSDAINNILQQPDSQLCLRSNSATRAPISVDVPSPLSVLGLEHHQEHPRHKCSQCNRVFSQPSKLKKHSNTHTRPFKCEDPDCQNERGFAMLKDLRRHQKSVHKTSGSLFVCSFTKMYPTSVDVPGAFTRILRLSLEALTQMPNESGQDSTTFQYAYNNHLDDWRIITRSIFSSFYEEEEMEEENDEYPVLGSPEIIWSPLSYSPPEFVRIRMTWISGLVDFDFGRGNLWVQHPLAKTGKLFDRDSAWFVDQTMLSFNIIALSGPDFGAPVDSKFD